MKEKALKKMKKEKALNNFYIEVDKQRKKFGDINEIELCAKCLSSDVVVIYNGVHIAPNEGDKVVRVSNYVDSFCNKCNFPGTKIFKSNEEFEDYLDDEF
ncbi:hypothetical protein [Carboxylicivirga sp. RSCT41]|uniref:hypothetical protein n=1 Tax=Carboxylicivirga agarovorans TaxID=3417570 RepID=UPI003D3325BA